MSVYKVFGCVEAVSVLQSVRVHRGVVGFMIFVSGEMRCRCYKEFGSVEARCRFTKCSGL